ncbi:TPA: nucleotidyltransferase domain-containing protein [Candidatus Acetothermia bacterium]|nr:nucleotidyltransferase domain-containing protein [Candidatus Acetothermia bacterium]HAZ30451.1 nucleotidyltransferase domain-containing protein [Candidatus Acetothermia bacterium]
MPDRERLPEVFCSYPEIQAVYLFGSAAEGRAGLRSDLDLAIVSDSPRLREKRLDILADLVRAGFDEVDLVFIDEDRDLVLAYEAVRANCLVYARPDFDRGGTYSRVVRKYLDFEHFLRIQREALKRRVLRGAA